RRCHGLPNPARRQRSHRPRICPPAVPPLAGQIGGAIPRIPLSNPWRYHGNSVDSARRLSPRGFMASTTLQVNGKRYGTESDPETPLLTVLRDEIGLTGSKYGCGEGQCGACTVLIAGAPRRSCQIPLRAAAGKPVTTIEGLEKNGQLHPVQQ